LELFSTVSGAMIALDNGPQIQTKIRMLVINPLYFATIGHLHTYSLLYTCNHK